MKLQKPQMEVVRFSQEDVIATSGGGYVASPGWAPEHSCNNVAPHVLVKSYIPGSEVGLYGSKGLCLESFDQNGVKLYNEYAPYNYSNKFNGYQSGATFDFDNTILFGQDEVWFRERTDLWYYLGDESVYHPCSN